MQCGNPLANCDGARFPPEPAHEAHVGDGRPITPNPPSLPSITEPTFIPGLSKCVGTPGFCEAQATEAKQQLEKQFPPGKIRIGIPPPVKGTVIVLWESSPPVRVAEAKLGIATTSNRRATESYVVSVMGYPMLFALGQAIDPRQPLPSGVKQLIQQSALLTVKDKHPISAVDVELEGSENAMNVRFFFPADPPIQTNDKKVVLRMQVLLGDVVEAEFALKDMVYEGKQAISEETSVGASQR